MFSFRQFDYCSWPAPCNNQMFSAGVLTRLACIQESALKIWKKIPLNPLGFASGTQLAGLAERSPRSGGAACRAITWPRNVTQNIHIMSVWKLIWSCFLSPCTTLEDRNKRTKECVFASVCVEGRRYTSKGGGTISVYLQSNRGIPELRAI